MSTPSQLAAGVAGGLATGDTAGAVTGGQAGKNAVYNNYLSSTEARQLDKEMQECKSSGGDCNKVVEKYIDISNKTVRSWLKPVPVAVLLVAWQELIRVPLMWRMMRIHRKSGWMKS